jgi:peptide/nickel transport system substrate-binding protein
LRNTRLSKITISLCIVLLIVALSLIFACGGPEPTTPATTTPAATTPAATTPTASIPPSVTPSASMPTVVTPETPTPTAPADNIKRGGILRIGRGAYQHISLGYPPTMGGDTDGYYSEPGLDTLFTYDTQLKIVPRLALDFTVADDAKSVTMHLRKGVKFHDGSDWNAEVCKWNLEGYIASPKKDIDSISSIDIIDDYTIKLNLESYDATLLSKFCQDPGRMISKLAYDTYGQEYCEKHPVGTGPFKFVSWERDVALKWERNENYWQEGLPYLDGVEILWYADSTTLLIAFKNGDFDIIETGGKDAESLMAEADYNVTVSTNGMTPFLSGDSIHPDSPFNDLRVRQAMSYAVDQYAMNDAITYGWGKATNQWSPPGTPGYNPDVIEYPYNPDKAKALLAEAGYGNGFDTKILAFATDPSVGFGAVGTATASFLEDIGIHCDLQLLQLAQYDLVATAGGWENGICVVATYTRPEILDSMQAILTYDSVKFPSMMRPPGAEDVFQEARESRDLESKYDALFRLQKILVDEFCMAKFLYVQGNVAVKNTYIHNDEYFERAMGYVSPSTWLDK